MRIFQPDSLRWFAFETLLDEKLNHAIFSRRGGVSPVPWAELNLGGTVGDAAENVHENRRRAFQAIGRPVESLYDVWQVHSAEVVHVKAPRPLNRPHRKADAMITDQPGVTLMMRFADCVPILLYDPTHKAVALAHAGWQGTVKKIVLHTIEAMHEAFSTDPVDLIAGIAPSICEKHYPVGAEVVLSVHNSFSADTHDVLHTYDGKPHFNLWRANQLLLLQAGVRQITISGICTACHPEDWYSHRGERGKTGRFGVLVALEG